MLENTDNPTVDNADNASLNTETSSATETNEVVANEPTSAVAEVIETEQINQAESVVEVISNHDVVEPSLAAEEKLDDETQDVHEDGVAIDELVPQENYFALSQKELIAKMQEICNHADVFGNKKYVKSIREAYRNHQKETLATNLAKFKEAGGDPKEFEAPENPLDETFNELQKRFNQKVADENKRKERELQTNLKARLELIAEVKAIADAGTGAEGLSMIHELQAKWRTLGIVPAADTDTTWKNFNHHINRYFDGINT